MKKIIIFIGMSLFCAACYADDLKPFWSFNRIKGLTSYKVYIPKNGKYTEFKMNYEDSPYFEDIDSSRDYFIYILNKHGLIRFQGVPASNKTLFFQSEDL